jgi:2-polyprenyl-3-methyl-5-hydroxy-6-metoxy-1,4-benzoquinol methylase
MTEPPRDDPQIGLERDARARRFFARPDQYLSKNPNLAIRARILRSMLGECTGMDVLDFGCGDGSLTAQFLPRVRSLTLADRSSQMLELAKDNMDLRWGSRVRFVEADVTTATNLGTFDVILCVGVLAHVRSVSETLDSITGQLAPGGRCVLQITDSGRMIESLLHAHARLKLRCSGDAGYLTNRMSAEEIQSALESRGLQLQAARNYSLLLPGMGPLPSPLKGALQRASWTRPRLSRHASEAIMLFRAPTPSAE